MWKRIHPVVPCACLCLALSALACQAGKPGHPVAITNRQALLIGNAHYHGVPLATPQNNVQALATVLGKLGWAVACHNDLTSQDMNQACSAFFKRITPHSAVCIYFSGYAAAAGNSNRLLAIDADRVPDNLSLTTSDLRWFLQHTVPAAHVTILDVTQWSNHSASTPPIVADLASAGGAQIYSLSPGQVPMPAAGPYSLFTAQLLACLQGGDLQIPDMLGRLQQIIRIESAGTQLPWLDRQTAVPFSASALSAPDTLAELKKFNLAVELRSSPAALSPMQLSVMLRQKNLFVKAYTWNMTPDNVQANPTGVCRHLYESATLGQDPVVIDHATNRMWHQNGSATPLSFAQVNAWINSINAQHYAGFADWRLPTAEEAASLIERTPQNGRLYIARHFSQTQRYVWTADWTDTGSPRHYVADLCFGHVYWSIIDSFYVRPVRATLALPI